MSIPAIINEACRKLGVDYKSQYDTGDLTEKDINRLMSIYIQLKQICADLIEIEERHDIINGLKEDIMSSIDKLELIGHVLFEDAHKLKNQL